MAIEITREVERFVLQRREQLRKDLEEGVRELDNGEGVEADSVFASLRQRAAEPDGNTE